MGGNSSSGGAVSGPTSLVPLPSRYAMLDAVHAPNASLVEPALAVVSLLGFTRPVNMQLHITPRNYHLLLVSPGRNVAYFKVPCVVPDPGPAGMPMVNLVSGSVGTIISVVAHSSGVHEIACSPLARAWVCSSSDVLAFAHAEVARARAGVRAVPATMLSPAPRLQAHARSSKIRVRPLARLAKIVAQNVAPSRRESTRIRAQANPLFVTTLDKAAQLKVACLGKAAQAAPDTAAPLSPLEICALVAGCALDDPNL